MIPVAAENSIEQVLAAHELGEWITLEGTGYRCGCGELILAATFADFIHGERKDAATKAHRTHLAVALRTIRAEREGPCNRDPEVMGGWCPEHSWAHRNDQFRAEREDGEGSVRPEDETYWHAMVKCTERSCGTRVRYSELTDNLNTHWHLAPGVGMVPESSIRADAEQAAARAALDIRTEAEEYAAGYTREAALSDAGIARAQEVLARLGVTIGDNALHAALSEALDTEGLS